MDARSVKDTEYIRKKPRKVKERLAVDPAA
jgi:hypothetical protein